MNKFKQLCYELVEELAAETSLYPGYEREVVSRARAVLKESESFDVRDAVLAEREACAQICDRQYERARTSTGASRADSCATAIRARSLKEFSE
jgi:hypothetical protein